MTAHPIGKTGDFCFHNDIDPENMRPKGNVYCQEQCSQYKWCSNSSTNIIAQFLQLVYYTNKPHQMSVSHIHKTLQDLKRLTRNTVVVVIFNVFFCMLFVCSMPII